MAKFKGYALVTLHVPLSFEVDDEDAGNEESVQDCATYAAEDAVFGAEGQVEEIDVREVERVGK